MQEKNSCRNILNFPLPFDSLYMEDKAYAIVQLPKCVEKCGVVEVVSSFWSLMYRYCYLKNFPLTVRKDSAYTSNYFTNPESSFELIEKETEQFLASSLNKVVEQENRESILFVLDEMENVSEEAFGEAVLVIRIAEKNGKVTGQIYYEKSLFTKDTIQRLLANYEYFLGQILEDKKSLLSSYEIVTPGEIALLKGFNSKDKDWNYHITYMEQFYTSVRQHYEKDAIVQGAFKLSYRELNNITNYYGEKIVSSPGSYVGIYSDNDAATEIGVLSILKAGKTVVAINPTYPKERISYIVKALSIEVIVTNKMMKNSQIEEGMVHQVIEVDPAISLDREYQNVYVPVSVQDICYVIFTSGTTGEPKGVLITQENIMIEINFFRDYFEIDSSFKGLHNLNYSFDFGLYDILSPFLFGGTLYSVDKSTMRSFVDYITFINQEEINFINTTPSFFNLLSGMRQSMPTLRGVHLGGEKVTYPMVHNYVKVVSENCEIYNGYGPCECTVGSNIYQIPYNEKYNYEPRLSSVPIGEPTDNSEVYVLDSNLKYVPVNALGELCIGGESVGKGYVDKSKNEGKFVEFEGKRIYRTGDLVRWLDSGVIEFIGRIDSQVKINGFRIELSEIDTVLAKHSNIAEAKSICVENEDKKIIVSFVKLGEKIALSEIKKYVMEYVPYYMVPSKMIELEEFPYLASGKIDVKKLSCLL